MGSVRRTRRQSARERGGRVRRQGHCSCSSGRARRDDSVLLRNPAGEHCKVNSNLARRIVAEGLGTALLLAAVIGSGIMGERLAGGNVGIALLANTIATGAALATLILTFGPISGAHFNPAVTLSALSQRELSWPEALSYIVAQLMGAGAGALAANAMFGGA